MMVHLLGSLTWAPGFKGILTVAVAVAILCGSVALILGTNSGARLGFLIALTGLLGWFFVMGIIWATYGIGYKGPAPTWKVVDTTTGSPESSRIAVADSLPLPSDLPDPVAERDNSPELTKEFPLTGKDPSLGDLVTVDPSLRTAVNDQLGVWKILETSNKYTGEAASVVGEVLGPDDKALFTSPSDYIVLDTFVTGGKTGRSDNSIIGRVKYKFTSAVQFNNKPFYAAVQLQPVIPQETKPGQAPPLPVANPDAPVYTVILERDRGALRLPSSMFTLASGLAFAVCANMLHRRDKLAMAQRAAVAGAGRREMGQYLPVLVMLVLGAGFAGVSLVMSKLVSPKRPSAAKAAPYECGIVPRNEPPERFPVRFYLVAMIFIVFDIEIIFLYPYAVIFRELGWFGLAEMLIFAVAVFASFVFLIANGALDWGPVARMRRTSPEVSTTRTTTSTVRRVGTEGRRPGPGEGVAA